MKTRLLLSIIISAIVFSSVIGYLIYLDTPKTPWDCRMKYGKVKQDIQNCLDNLPSEIESSHIKSESIPEPKVTDSLEISNTERDTKLSAGYKLYPGVGWVHPDAQGNLQPIYKNNPDNPEELILDIDAMIKEYDLNPEISYLNNQVGPITHNKQVKPLVEQLPETPPHDPYSDDERLRLASEKKFVSEETMGFGSGIGFFDESNFQLNTIIIATIIGVGSGIGLTVYWRKRK